MYTVFLLNSIQKNDHHAAIRLLRTPKKSNNSNNMINNCFRKITHDKERKKRRTHNKNYQKPIETQVHNKRRIQYCQHNTSVTSTITTATTRTTIAIILTVTITEIIYQKYQVNNNEDKDIIK